MLINYKNGSSRYGLIVTLRGSVMRVALADNDDLLEFRLVNDNWVADNCEVVSFDFPPGVGQNEVFRTAVQKEVRPLERLYDYVGPETFTRLVN